MTALPMPSSFEVPDVKKQLSARVRLSIHEKLAHIRDLWTVTAEGKGKTKEQIDAIDMTHVIDVLLARVVDEELQQFGGMPETAEARTAQLKAARDAAKAQTQTKKS